MSFQAMAWAVEQDLPMREKMVLLILANYASNERGDCHPSVGLLAKDCGASKDSIIRAIKSLEDQGFVSVNRRMSDGVNLPNTYTLNMRGVVAESDHRGSSTQRGGVVAESDTNLSSEPINTSSLRSDAISRKPAKPSVKSELMKVLDADHAQAVIEHRKAIKKAMSPRAAHLLAAEFAKCPDPHAAADMMIAAGWQGFKAEWAENRNTTRNHAPPGRSGSGNAAVDLLDQMISTMEERNDDFSGPTIEGSILGRDYDRNSQTVSGFAAARIGYQDRR